MIYLLIRFHSVLLSHDNLCEKSCDKSLHFIMHTKSHGEQCDV